MVLCSEGGGAPNSRGTKCMQCREVIGVRINPLVMLVPTDLCIAISLWTKSSRCIFSLPRLAFNLKFSLCFLINESYFRLFKFLYMFLIPYLLSLIPHLRMFLSSPSCMVSFQEGSLPAQVASSYIASDTITSLIIFLVSHKNRLVLMEK